MKKSNPQIKQFSLSKLAPAEYNPCTISEKALGGLTESIKRFGLIQPIVWNKRTGRIVAGHQRVAALKALGQKTAGVVVVDWPESQEKQANLALNNKAIEGDFTADVARLLKEIEASDKEAFDALLLDMITVPTSLAYDIEGDEEGVGGVPREPTTKPGDIYKMGPHRLLCGDALNHGDLSKLMGGAEADLVFTDPPYNVDYEGGTEEGLKILNDKMSDEAFVKFLYDAFASYRLASKNTASMYVCHPSSYQREFQNAIEGAGFQVRTQIIWAKNTFAWGFGRYKFQHEPIFYAYVKGGGDEWYGDLSQSTLWQEKKPAANRLHPTMKPIELVARAIQNSSVAGDVVLDLFGGSGSTLIAADKLGRTCYMMELDPGYCDVIVERWEKLSGKKAQRI